MAGNLTRYSPFGELARFAPFGSIDEILREFGAPSSLLGKDGPQGIRMDIVETGQNYTVKAEIAGCRKEDISISVEGNAVSISAETRRESEAGKEGNLLRSERYVGQMYRSFTLPQAVDEDKVQATYRDGVLELVLPKKTAGSSKQIQVQ